jgi:hypothetical protein
MAIFDAIPGSFARTNKTNYQREEGIGYLRPPMSDRIIVPDVYPRKIIILIRISAVNMMPFLAQNRYSPGCLDKQNPAH